MNSHPKMFKIKIAIIFLIVLIGWSNGQNISELIRQCNLDVAKWEAEAGNWYSKFVTFVTVSVVFSVFSIIGKSNFSSKIDH